MELQEEFAEIYFAAAVNNRIPDLSNAGKPLPAQPSTFGFGCGISISRAATEGGTPEPGKACKGAAGLPPLVKDG